MDLPVSLGLKTLEHVCVSQFLPGHEILGDYVERREVRKYNMFDTWIRMRRETHVIDTRMNIFSSYSI